MGTTTARTTEKPDMAERIEAEADDNPLCHEWVAAAEVAIDSKTARRAAFRGSFRTEAGMRVDALETYCRRCKRPMDDVADKPCVAKIDNAHLIGGDPGVRAKRIVHEPVGRMVKAPPINRRGADGYSVHAGR